MLSTKTSRYIVASIIFSLFISFAAVVSSTNVSITIPLNKTLTHYNRELYGEFYNISSNSVLKFTFENVNKDISFIIFQAHSHLYNVTLYNNTKIYGSYNTGTNVGLYSNVKSVLDTFYVLNDNVVELKLFISVHGYKQTDPIPGGANMEFPVPISPFMAVLYNKDYIFVDAAPASDSKPAKADVTFYKMFLPEQNYDSDTYFKGIRNLMTMETILEHGDEIPLSPGYPSLMRRVLASYPGTGAVYVAVAYNTTNSSQYSVYVPTYTYACSPLDEGSCDILDSGLTRILCACLLFVGLFVCYFGHRFFKTEMFLAGMFFGVIVSYIVIAIKSDLETSVLLGASTLLGVFFGAIWLLFWWFYGIPLFAVLLAALHLGFLISSLMFFSLPGGLPYLEEDLNFWTVFIVIMSLTSFTLVTVTFMSNILCCAVLGAYAVVFSVDHYLGSNLKYIINNTVRRAVVHDFKYAVMSPPFQWRDALVTLLWVMLAVSGLLVQHYHNLGRPPFPPPSRSISPVMPGYTQHRIAPRERRYNGTKTEEVSVSEPLVASTSVVYDERTPLLA